MPAVAANAANAPFALPTETFRSVLLAQQDQRRTLPLDAAVAALVPLCLELHERHHRGERFYVHPSAVVRGPASDPGLLFHSSLARWPSEPHDVAALAPEVIQSSEPGDARASVFAVGAMLYEAVTGTAVGPAMRRPRELNPALPEALDLVLAKALISDPAHRPGDLGALATALHQLAPSGSMPPPPSEARGLDEVSGQPVDTRMSLLPPVEVQFSMPPPRAAVAAATDAQASRPRSPTEDLAQLKTRLESDPRPRYVVNKDRMDHGPFSAVELLQQIASNQFVSDDVLRDDVTGTTQKIAEWHDFAPFAQHAGMHRNLAQEKKDVARIASAEKKAGAAKFIVGGILASALLVGGVLFIMKNVGERKESGDLTGDPNAVDLSGGAALKGVKKASALTGGNAGGGAGGYAGGGSYEAALNANNQEVNLGGAKAGPDLTNAQINAPMKNAAFISGCGAPESMKVKVQVAIKNGRAVGVSVYPSPPSAAVAQCIDRHVRGLSWPANPKMDFFTTNY